MQKQSLPETGFIRLPIVLHHIPVSKSTWWAGVKSGRYPKPVKLGVWGGCGRGWLEVPV